MDVREKGRDYVAWVVQDPTAGAGGSNKFGVMQLYPILPASGVTLCAPVPPVKFWEGY